jgi:hypothetical protein
MMHLFAVFGAGFLTVFFAAFQSRCVNHGDHWLATGNSFLIGISSAVVWRQIATGTGWAEVLVYGASGAVAVNCAMWLHKWLKRHGK